MAEHTPTPWTDAPPEYDCDDNTAPICGAMLYDATGQYIWRLELWGGEYEGLDGETAAKIRARVNAFHSPDRHIPTEQIAEGLFWRMRDLLEDAGETIELLANRLGAPTESADRKADAEGYGSWDALQDIRTLLDSLKVQQGDGT